MPAENRRALNFQSSILLHIGTMTVSQSASSVAQDLIVGLKTFNIKIFSQVGLIEKPKTFMLAPGYYIVLKVSPDESLSIADDYYGPGQFSKWVKNDSVRPEGFTGAAIKVARDGNFCLWWEPERYDGKIYNDEKTVQYIKNVLRDGYLCASLVLKGPAKDLFGNEHTVTLWQSCCGSISYPYESDDEGIYDMFKEMLLDLESAINEHFVNH